MSGGTAQRPGREEGTVAAGAPAGATSPGDAAPGDIPAGEASPGDAAGDDAAEAEVVAGAHQVERSAPEGGHEGHDEEDLERAEELEAEMARRNEDPQTYREALEQELAEEGISDEGIHLGQHVE